MNTSTRTSLISFAVVALLAMAAMLVCVHATQPQHADLLSSLPTAVAGLTG